MPLRSRRIRFLSSNQLCFGDKRWNSTLTGSISCFAVDEVQKRLACLAAADVLRDLTLFNVAIDSKLRGCDLVKLAVTDLVKEDRALERVSIIQSKSKRPVQFELTENTREAIGLGASSISRFPEGYVQNAPATAAYIQRITSGCLPGARGFQMTQADRLHARSIERLMCTFALDLEDLRPEFGRGVESLIPQVSEIAGRFAPFVVKDGSRIAILPEGRPLTRIIASVFDQHVPEGVRYSRAS